MTEHRFLAAFVFAAVAFFTVGSVRAAGASHVQLQKNDTGFTLVCDGKPFFIQGAGGDASKEVLAKQGANSFRTWGAEDIDEKLDEAQQLGLKVTVGIWLGHERHKFDYNNSALVKAQFERARAAVMKYKDHPAVLLWAVGNEMEGYAKGDNPKIWAAVQDIAAMIKQVDPHHPTMTVVAEVGGDRVKCINTLCPAIDIVGINTYAGGPSIAERYRAAGGVKPFIVTEFGPGGTWEVEKTPWGAPVELTSTDKAAAYRATYEKSVLPEKGRLCLGSYVFAWGNKQEATSTWYGLFLPDGSRLEAIDTMLELWSGRKPANRCPQISPLKVDVAEVDPGATIHATLNVKDPEGDPLTVKWELHGDTEQYQTGGDLQPVPPSYPEYIAAGDLKGATLKIPADAGGGYWLYAFVFDGKGGAATASIPLRVNGPIPKPRVPKVRLPFVLYADGLKDIPYVWSGWMGDLSAINMDEKNTTQPHSGKTAMKCEFRSDKGFGGIVWQSPANDWGQQFGGFNITGARKLSFWARGEQGGEIVTFKFGIIGKDAPYPDSDTVTLENVTLGKEWHQYSIDVATENLSCIKTGFAWNVGGQGRPIAFYLDDVQFE